MLATKTDRFAAAVARLGSESAFEVLARARALEAQGKRVVHMEIGEPDFETPKHIKEAGIKAILENHSHYTPSAGIVELCEALLLPFLLLRKSVFEVRRRLRHFVSKDLEIVAA